MVATNHQLLSVDGFHGAQNSFASGGSIICGILAVVSILI